MRGGGGETRQVQQEYTSLATERVIPLRVIHVLPSAGAQDNADVEWLTLSVARANEVFKAAGIQFVVSRVERFVMPTFGVLDFENIVQWASVRNELKGPFPNLVDATWPGTDFGSELLWLERAQLLWGEKHEAIVWVHKLINLNPSGATINWGGKPEANRMSAWMIGNIDIGGQGAYGDAPPYILAHELGHALGLPHPFEEPNYIDPLDVSPRTGSDAWDMVHRPAPLTFYSDQAAASAAQQAGHTLQPITSCDASGNCNCWFSAANGTIQCSFGAQTYATGDTQIRGIAMATAAGNAVNVMAGGVDNRNGYAWSVVDNFPRFLSDSQIWQMRKHLQYEMPMPQTRADDLDLPGVSPNSQRPRLGTWDIQRSGPFLDFNGDGRRDLAVWDPPTTIAGTGTFRIVKSPSFLTSTQWTVSLGVLGDVPMPADYNGDGCTDVGVWRTNGPNGTDSTNNDGFFVYCLTPKSGSTCSAPTCSTVTIAQFGLRSDVPVSDARLHGGTGGSVTVFRPSNGTFYWRTYVSGGSNGGFPTPSTSKTFGASRYGAAPLVGDYDDDGINDPAIYITQEAKYEILRSGASYAKWTRSFPAVFAPSESPTGTPLQFDFRGSVIPYEGAGVLLFSRPAAYFPAWRSWSTMWNVASGSTTTTCLAPGGATYQTGFPIGSIDRDGDWRSDMVVFGLDGASSIVFKNSASGTCTGTTTTRTYTGLGSSARMRVFGAHDLTGDGKPDIILLDPDAMKFYWASSDSDYVTLNSRQFGTSRSVPL